METPHNDIKNNLTIKKLLSKMPKHVSESFNDEQLTHIMTAIGARNWGKHAIDFRGTFKIPLYRWRFYYVTLIGRNKRELSRKEKQLSLLTTAFFTTTFIIFSVLIGGLILYIIKSALGIDVLPNHSLGIWDWFKEAF